jgi:Fe-S cluster assembly protein SufD
LKLAKKTLELLALYTKMFSDFAAFQDSQNPNVIDIPANSRVLIFGKNLFLDFEAFELKIGADSEVQVYEVCDKNSPSSVFVTQDQNSSFVYFKLVQSKTNFNFNLEILGDNTQTKLQNLIFPSAGSQVSLNQKVFASSNKNQIIQHTKIIQNFDSNCEVLHSIKAFSKAKNLVANQKIQAIKNHPKAKTQLQPILEIETPLVSCNHGASVGKFENSESDYLVARGLSKKTAQRLLAEAFLNELLETVQILCIREKLTSLTKNYFEL